jgi:hypothetical protein
MNCELSGRQRQANRVWLEPISKLSEEDNEAGELEVSRPGNFTTGLSQNRARDSRLTRLPSSKRAGHTEPPMYEQVRVVLSQSLQKATRADPVSFKATELPHRPSQ